MALSKDNSYVIGCKLPNGLVIRGAGKQFRLNGANTQTSELIYGFGVTKNVPAEIWEDYQKHHAGSNIIRNGTVFAVGDMNSARDAAKDQQKQLTGLEQIDPKKTETKPDSDEE